MANKSIFSRLQRLFSTDVIIRNVGGNQVKVMDSSTIQSTGEIETNSLIDRYNRIYTNSSTSLYGSQFNFNYQYLRPQLYSEYDVMDQDAIIASALDIIADESSLKNDMGEVLSIRSANEDIQKILYNLFYDVLNIEFNLWSWTRQMCKYGDFFLKLEIAEKYGVYNVIPYTAFHISREEGFNPENPADIRYRYSPDGIVNSNSGMYRVPGQDPNNSPGVYFDNYEMAHFRLIADVNYLPYGRSYIEPARKLFKQYTLMEDAMLIHRIARAPEKRAFYVNVGAIPPNEVDAFMQKTINNMKRTPMMDEKTGEYNLKYNMQNMLEDFYIPVRGNDSATKIAFSSEVYDTDGTYDTSNYRFTPGVVGKYIIGFAYWASNNDNIKTANLYIYKNGSVSNFGSLQYITRLNSGTFSRIAMSATFQVDVTSASDYFEAYAKIENTSGDAIINGQTSKDNNYFYGYKLIT